MTGGQKVESEKLGVPITHGDRLRPIRDGYSHPVWGAGYVASLRMQVHALPRWRAMT